MEGLVAHVAWQDDIASQAPGERVDPFFQRVALVGERELRTLIRKRLGDPPGDGFIIGQPHNETAFSVHQSHACRPSCRRVSREPGRCRSIVADL